ncbi:MAG: endonuclease/exonuclease/phosphatase family protein [Candidatus Binatia bacterium]
MRCFLVVLLTTVLTTSCRIAGIQPVSPLAVEQRSLPHRFTIVSWNVQKENDERMQADLYALLRRQRPELVFLQEATAELLDLTPLPGRFAPSWQYPLLSGSATGVMTLSQVDPVQSEAVQTRWREFFLATPKVALATVYPLPTGARLLAINVHCLNFERWGTFKLRAQLTALKRIMERHTGPILLGGDFNTWNQRRLRLVTALARELNLTEVRDFSGTPKTGDRQSTILNWLLGIDRDLPLDRVYYRGLSPLSAAVFPASSSDHSALQVTFSVNGASATDVGSIPTP